MAKSEHAEFAEFQQFADKDGPLRDDIRLLGAVLGDTIRDQEGDGHLQASSSRSGRASVRFHRDRSAKDAKALHDILGSLSPRQAALVVRSFSYFSHLANIAEDAHHRRRTRAHDDRRIEAAPRHDPPRAGGRDVERHHARTSCGPSSSAPSSRPVLTAHPTEVRRRSTQTWEMAVTRRLDLLQRARPHRGGARADPRGDPRGRCCRCGRRASCAAASSPSSTRSPTASPITITRCSPKCPCSTRRSRRRWRASPRSSQGNEPEPAIAVVPAPRQLDRRRPRRQPLRHGRGGGDHGTRMHGMKIIRHYREECLNLRKELTLSDNIVRLTTPTFKRSPISGRRRQRGAAERGLPARAQRDRRSG